MNRITSPLCPDKKRVELTERFSINKVNKGYQLLGLNVERFFQNEDIELYKCLSTGYRFYHPPSIIGDANFYRELSSTRKNYYSERWDHKKSLEFIQDGEKVLEIGSGFGGFLQMLKNKKIQAKGLELNKDAVNQCQEQDLDVEGTLIEDFSYNLKEHYDVVCSFQVLEHIYYVYDFLYHQLKVLKKGGKLIIGVPNNNPYLFINDKYNTLNLPPHHAGLWNGKSLFSLEKIFNLKVERMIYEPLELSYGYFIEFNLNQMKNTTIRTVLKKIERKYRSIFRKVLSKFINGRNILVVYQKL